MIGLSVSALRRYERLGLIVFHRTAGNQRILTLNDVTRIRNIQTLMKKAGLNVEGILRLWALIPCWKIKDCPPLERTQCPAHDNSDRPCWVALRFSGCVSAVNCADCDVYLYSPWMTGNLKSMYYDLIFKNE